MHSPRTNQPKLDYVDALRGVAVLLVVLVHLRELVPSAEIFHGIARLGQFGVQLFFVMSAFTLCLSAERENLGFKDYGRFMVRRFFRIAPMYYIALLIYELIALSNVHILQLPSPFAPADKYSWHGVLVNFLFLHEFHPFAINGIVPGGWSIATEFCFYAIFPALFIVTRARGWPLGILAAGCWAVLFFFVKLATSFGRFDEGNNSFFYFSLLCQLPCFLCGFVLHRRLKFGPVRWWERVLGVAALGLVVVCYDSPWGWFFTPLLSGIGFAVLGAELSQWNMRRNILSRIGEVSYSVYLLHFLVIWWASYAVDPLRHVLGSYGALVVLFFGVCAVSYFLARIAYIHVEKPGIRFGRIRAERMKEAALELAEPELPEPERRVPTASV